MLPVPRPKSMVLAAIMPGATAACPAAAPMLMLPVEPKKAATWTSVAVMLPPFESVSVPAPR
jgi:hypothetical protein